MLSEIDCLSSPVSSYLISQWAQPLFWIFENLIARNLHTLDYDDFSTVLQTDIPPTGASLCAGYNMANANMNFKFPDLYSWYRCSHQWCSTQKGVLRNFTKFIGKHMCQGLLFNKVAGLKTPMPEVLKKRVLHRCFPVNFVKFLRIPFLQNTAGRLLPLVE